MFYGNSTGDYNFDLYASYGYAIQNYSAQYTTLTFTLPSDAPREGQMEFQVQALEGYTNCTTVGEPHIFFVIVNYSFYGEKSGWSNTQTITISATNATSTPNLTVPEFPSFSITIALAVIPLITVFLKKRICLEA